MTYYIQTREGKILKGKSNIWNEVWRGLSAQSCSIHILKERLSAGINISQKWQEVRSRNTDK